MNPADPGHDDFERRLRKAHATALEAVSPRTRLQLQLRRGAATYERPPAMRRLAWPLVATCAAAALAIGLGVQWRQPSPGDKAPVLATTIPASNGEDAYLALEESPDFYLWLASEDAALLAME